jgi:predicted nucleic acid-binding protein
VIYLDSCILIYAIEHYGGLGDRARRALEGETAAFAISPLVAHEALVMPLRRADETLIEEYGRFFSDCALLPHWLDDYVRAAELRAQTPGLTTIDALHLATAQLAGCTALWTNDRRLAAAAGDFAVDIVGPAG